MVNTKNRRNLLPKVLSWQVQCLAPESDAYRGTERDDCVHPLPGMIEQSQVLIFGIYLVYIWYMSYSKIVLGDANAHAIRPDLSDDPSGMTRPGQLP